MKFFNKRKETNTLHDSKTTIERYSSLFFQGRIQQGIMVCIHNKHTLTFLLYNFERTITLLLVLLDFFKLLKYKNIYNAEIKRY